MELLLIRHALPVRLEKSDGTPADPPLSSTGREQAERLARWLEHETLDAVYTSPLQRARETAEPLARGRGLELRVEAGVAEFDQHASTYIPMEELKALDYERWKALVQSGFYLDGEVADFRRTVVESLERVIEANAGRRVAVVCHGGVINCFAGSVLGVEEPFLFLDAGYTSISRFLVASSGERSVVSLNETGHLRVASRS